MGMIVSLLSTLIYYYSWALIIYILMSWFPNARGSKIGQLLTRICEPYLEPFRRFIPPRPRAPPCMARVRDGPCIDDSAFDAHLGRVAA